MNQSSKSSPNASTSQTSEFVVLPRARTRRARSRGALAVGCVLALVGAAGWVGWRLAPRQPGVSMERAQQVQHALQQARGDAERLRQKSATLRRSDQISRAANRKIQHALAAREAKLDELRSQLAFFERLTDAARATGGLDVHSVEFTPEPSGAWRYRIVLTQGLGRDVISEGGLRFAVDGVRDGQLVTLDWNDLHQRPEVEPQAYAFRYFQQLRGRVMLPAGFVPKRVRVSLHGDDVSLDQALAWQQPAATGKPHATQDT